MHEEVFGTRANTNVVQNKDSMYPPISRLVATKNGSYIQSSKTENGLGVVGFLMLPETVLAIEVEFVMFVITSLAQTQRSGNNGEVNSLYRKNTQFIVSDQKTQLTTETQEAIVPSKPVISIDDHITDYDKLCGVFLQKLKGKAAMETSLSQTRVSLKRDTIETIVKRASLSD